MNNGELTAEQHAFHERLVYDHEFFARHLQRIEMKDLEENPVFQAQLEALDSLSDAEFQAGTIPFIFKPGQIKLSRAIEEQKRRRGIVKMALVKPRQVGWSTIIQSRAHFLVQKTPGMRVSIISHTSESTNDFLRRAKIFFRNTPIQIAPDPEVENAKTIICPNGASYSIATAGTPAAMRSRSAHFFHGSEEPFWKEQQDTLGAVLPSLSRGGGSEAYRESTSKGKGNLWHNFILETIAGENDWEVFFDSWFNHPNYKIEPPPGWIPNDECREAQIRYRLSDAQTYWRAMMIKDLRALWLFKQEYPATIEESFQASAGTLYDPDVVAKARTTNILFDPYAPLIMGVDPARTGDRTVIVFRQGRVIRDVIVYPKMDDMRLVSIIADYLQRGYRGTKVTKCFIDYAIGEGPASRLRELGYMKEVTTVGFGDPPREERYLNKRIEMAMDLRDWFGDKGDQVSIPNSDDVASDLLAIPDFVQMDNSDKLKLVPKEQIKKDYGKSPDIFDAIILTFAYPVRAERVAQLQQFAKENLSHLAPRALSAVISDFESF